MKNTISNIFSFLLIIAINQVLNNRTTYLYCHTNLECLDTGCCHDSRCTSPSKCKKINKITYALVGCAGFIFIGLSFLVFIFKIKKTRKSVLELKKIDDKFYSKRRNSNVDAFRKLKKMNTTIA